MEMSQVETARTGAQENCQQFIRERNIRWHPGRSNGAYIDLIGALRAQKSPHLVSLAWIIYHTFNKSEQYWQTTAKNDKHETW